MTASNRFFGPISSNESRMVLKWFNGRNQKFGSGPGGTFDSQWDLSTKLKLYDNSGDPSKNMSTVIFTCEIDCLTNLAPGPGEFSTEESLGTDMAKINNTNLTIEITGGKIENDLVTLTTSLSQEVVDKINAKTHWLKVINYNNSGTYAVKSATTTAIEIDPKKGLPSGTNDFQSSETGVHAFVYEINEPSPAQTGVTDIQSDLQSGSFTAYVALMAWPSYLHTYNYQPGISGYSAYQPQIIHLFEVVPYWLLTSEMDTNGIIPTWNFACKCIIREKDYSDGSLLMNYWGNFEQS